MVVENSLHERMSPQVTPQQSSKFYLNQPLQKKCRLSKHIYNKITQSPSICLSITETWINQMQEKKPSEQLSPQVFGFEGITLRATSLCTTQESLLPWQPLAWIRGTFHTGQVQTWIYGSATTRVTSAFQAGRQRLGVRAALQPSGVLRLPGQRVTHKVCGQSNTVGGQKNEGIRKGLWLVKGFFNAFPASPACFVFKKLQFPSLPQPSWDRKSVV